MSVADTSEPVEKASLRSTVLPWEKILGDEASFQRGDIELYTRIADVASDPFFTHWTVSLGEKRAGSVD